MAVVRFLFILGLILVFVHRMVIGITPPWLDIVVVAYLLFVTIIAALVVALRKMKCKDSAYRSTEIEEIDLGKLK